MSFKKKDVEEENEVIDSQKVLPSPKKLKDKRFEAKVNSFVSRKAGAIVAKRFPKESDEFKKDHLEMIKVYLKKFLKEKIGVSRIQNLICNKKNLTLPPFKLKSKDGKKIKSPYKRGVTITHDELRQEFGYFVDDQCYTQRKKLKKVSLRKKLTKDRIIKSVNNENYDAEAVYDYLHLIYQEDQKKSEGKRRFKNFKVNYETEEVLPEKLYSFELELQSGEKITVYNQDRNHRLMSDSFNRDKGDIDLSEVNSKTMLHALQIMHASGLDHVFFKGLSENEEKLAAMCINYLNEHEFKSKKMEYVSDKVSLKKMTFAGTPPSSKPIPYDDKSLTFTQKEIKKIRNEKTIGSNDIVTNPNDGQNEKEATNITVDSSKKSNTPN